MKKKGNIIESNVKNQIVKNNSEEKIIMKKEDNLNIKNFDEYKKNKKFLVRYTKDEYDSIKIKIKNDLFIKNSKFIFKTSIFIPLIFLLNLILSPNFSLENNNDQKQNNEISFIIEGIGKQKLLGNDEIKPNEIIINEIIQKTNNIYFNSNKSLNNIIMRWDTPLRTCKDMFANMENITSMDLSQFDFSDVSDMSGMFYGCKKLKSINFKNVVTSSLIMMAYTFYNCESLVSLDLSYFDTSKVVTLASLFYNCRSLTSLNLENLNTQSVNDMNSMFYNDESLISLDLSNFDTNSVNDLEFIFYGCKSLIFINLISFNLKTNSKSENTFSEDIKELIYCINKNSARKIYDFLKSKNLQNDCENTCFSEPKKLIIEKKICVTACENDDIYVYEYNNECLNYEQYQNKLKTESITYEIEDNSTDKYSEVANSEIIIDSDSSKNMDIDGTTNTIKLTEEAITNANEEKTDITDTIEKIKITNKISIEKTNIENENNVETIEIIKKSYIENIVDSIKISEIEENTKITENIVPDKDYENTEKNTVDKIDNKTNEVYQNFSSINFFKNGKIINNENLNNDKIIELIKNDLLNGSLNILLENVTKLKQDLIVENNDIIFQITTTENQKNNNYSNISNINLGLCEDRLKTIYGIDKNLSLIILKIDYFMTGLLIPVIGYEVYHPINRSQLNLKYCEDILVKINIPVSINEDSLYKYDPNSEYYNDECYTYTTENGTDIILNDRQNEFINNNLSLCEENCSYNGYYTDTKKAICECQTKLKINSISEIMSDINILSNDFNNEESNNINLATMKCIDQLFSKDGLLTNIISYILIIITIFFCISAIIFTKYGFYIIEQDIKKILSKRKKNINELQYNIYSTNIKKKKKKKKKSIIVNPTKKKLKKSSTKIEKEQNCNSNIKLTLKSTNKIMNFEKNQYDNNISSFIDGKSTIKKKNILKKDIYDCELNNYKYKKALENDKRTYFECYIYLLKIKNPILFAFYPIKDYNIKIIKINLLCISFILYILINTLFFNNSVIHQIYEDGGAYNISFFLPKIIISFFISYFFSNIIIYFTISERNFLELKNTNDLTDDKIERIKRCLKIKYFIFYVLSFFFLILFWYYLSSFCAIYQNTQIYLIKNVFISFSLSFIFPLIINLIPCFLRIYSLKNGNNECIYNLSKIIQII